ncbi:hypothetical protein [Candidatus Solirubrobacter pratensis]|uniref:hypothetical protein n=1 Tax=Candidatus Solirubrobacter pratensis TaxID=1298857 RepID=UPI0004892A12|nr:hypothetical protein [Candidatus Solirubrobacter pratensis]
MRYTELVSRVARLDSEQAARDLIAEHAWVVGDVVRAKQDIGWVLGDLSEEQRGEALRWLPEDVMHPILGRDFRRRSAHELLELGRQFMHDQVARRGEWRAERDE